MGQIALENYTVGQPVSTEDPKIAANFATLQALLNGNLDAENLAALAVTAAKLGVLPQARVFNAAAISIPNVADTLLTFDSERWDSGTGSEQHSTSVNTGRLTCRTAGLYTIAAHVTWAANVGGCRAVFLRVNGATQIARLEQNANASAARETAQSIAAQYRLEVGDYVELLVFQNSGGALNVVKAGTNHSPELSWVFCSA